MLTFAKQAYSWLVDALPDLSNLILVLVGVIMSLPRLAEKIEGNAIARYVVGIGCLVVGLGGFLVGISQRRQETQHMTTLLTNTNVLVNDSNELIAEVGILLPQITTVNQEVADVQSQLRAAQA